VVIKKPYIDGERKPSSAATVGEVMSYQLTMV